VAYIKIAAAWNILSEYTGDHSDMHHGRSVRRPRLRWWHCVDHWRCR